MVLFDANMILRYLLNDNEQMAATAERYLNNGGVYVTIEVIAEVVHVLKGVYRTDRALIADTIKDFLDLVGARDKAVLKLAMDVFKERDLDFVDCILYSYHCVDGVQIAAFDTKLLNLISKARGMTEDEESSAGINQSSNA